MAYEPRYLGLDLGLETGWALSKANRIIGSGVRDFRIRGNEGKGHRGIKFYNFLLKFGQVDEIYVEKIAFGGNFKNKKGVWVAPSSDGRELYHGLLMLVNMYADGFGIKVEEVHPGTLKKAFTGSGTAKKEDMCRMAHQLGWRGGESGTGLFHDEADALALLITQPRDRYGIQITF